MRLRDIRIRNYKGFCDSGTISFGDNWTVIVGRNNAGKTALLECLGRPIVNKPHRSPSQQPGVSDLQSSEIQVGLQIDLREITDAIPLNNAIDFPIPAPNISPMELAGDRPMFLAIRQSPNIDWQLATYPSHGLFEYVSGTSQWFARISRSSATGLDMSNTISGANDTLAPLVGRIYQRDSYVFSPERRVPGRSPQQDGLALNVTADNLPGALHFLYTDNPKRFQRYFSLIKRVLPDVDAITIPSAGGNVVQIKVWNSGYDEERSHLAINLEECGTGIGQVLAILFVAVTAETGKLIVIDEPNSFLHPGASRELMNVLKEFTKHQFIITTHSPELITSVEPDVLIVAQWRDHQSKVEVKDRPTLASIRTGLDEIGVRFSDLVGYDAIIWVEGAVEADCFPPLLQVANMQLPPRTAFLPVINTGDFDGADAKTYWRIYKRLADQDALMPRAIAISLDAENRPEKVRVEITKESAGLVQFLPRPTYENYLLHPGAIAAALNSADAECGIAESNISAWIDAHYADPEYYYSGGPRPTNEDDWRKIINAPKFLYRMISELTDNKQNFKANKVLYSGHMTRWLVAHEKQFLNEVVEYVSRLVRK